MLPLYLDLHFISRFHLEGVEAGRVRGTIQKKGIREIVFKGHRRRASKEEPQYIIKSDKTDHVAIHKGSVLKKVKKSSR